MAIFATVMADASWAEAGQQPTPDSATAAEKQAASGSRLRN
jgi:hypothetical protein